ncbi:hypothetical protein IT397_02215, partial [Candidatus Nomurabacteria bacterium]|nr:hypothetical protein [Candidatus Nomurabacteria bacterium]
MAVSSIISLLIIAHIEHLWAKPNIKVQADYDLYIDHDWGNLNLTQYVAIQNTGDANGSILKIKGLIRNKETKEIVCNFTEVGIESFGHFVPLVNFILMPYGNYSGLIRFSKLNTEDDKQYIANTKNYIFKYLDTFIQRHPYKRPYVPDDKFIGQKEFIKNKLDKFSQGSYEYFIQIMCDYQIDPLFEQAFSFSIFPADKEQLLQKTQEYQTGQNIYFKETNIPPKWGIHVNLIRIVDNQIINELRSKIQ